MKYLLDTKAVSALMRAEPRALERLRAAARSDVAVPQPVFAEIRYGLARVPKSKRRRQLEARWALFERELPRAPWTDEVSARFGALKALLEKRGKRIEDLDLAIAADALAHGATLVTADTEHMLRVPGLDVERWSD